MRQNNIDLLKKLVKSSKGCFNCRGKSWDNANTLAGE